MRAAKVKAFLTSRKTPGAVASYLSGFTRLEKEFFFMDLDFVVASDESYNTAMQQLDNLFARAILTSHDRSNFKSLLKEYRAFYLFDKKNPGWEKYVVTVKRGHKKMSAALSRLDLSSFYNNIFPMPTSLCNVSYHTKDRITVPHLVEIVEFEASEILQNMDHFLLGGIVVQPHIILSDRKRETTHYYDDETILTYVKEELKQSQSPAAAGIIGVIDLNNPIASVREIVKIKNDPNVQKDVDLINTISRIENILKNDEYSFSVNGTYSCMSKSISLYYREYDASTPEAFMADLRLTLSHELFHYYQHSCIGRIFMEHDWHFSSGISPNIINEMKKASAEDRDRTKSCRDRDFDDYPDRNDRDPDDEEDIDYDDYNEKVTIEYYDEYDIVRESLAEFYSLFESISTNSFASIWNYGYKCNKRAKERYNSWVEYLKSGWCYAYAICYMNTPSKYDIRISYNPSDYQTDGSLANFENVFKLSYIHLKDALDEIYRLYPKRKQLIKA